jgi:hypothetical protein
MTTWDTVIAKGTALFALSQDIHKQALFDVGIGLSKMAELKDDSKEVPCKLAPNEKAYKKALLWLTLLQGMPLADAALAYITTGRGVMTQQTHTLIVELVSRHTLLSPWLELFNEVW